MTVDQPAICVYCASGPVDDEYLLLAAEIGTGLADAGLALVSGGGKVSMMGSVARATRAAGGTTIGVIPEHLMAKEVADLDADEMIVTETMRDRKRIMEERADGFITLPGGIGTLEEFFETWTGGYLGEHDKPVVIVNLDGFYDPLLGWLHDLQTRGFVSGYALDRLIVVETAAEAIAQLTRR